MLICLKEELGLPTTTYYTKEEVTRDGTIVKNFTHIPSTVEALEIEEVAVEQLLRDVKNVSVGSVAALVKRLQDRWWLIFALW